MRERSRYIRSLGARGSEAHRRRFCRWSSVWWNEPKFGHKWLSCLGRWRFKNRSVRVLAGGSGCGSGLEVLQGFQCAEEHAVGGIDAPLNASKGIEGGVECVAERGIALDGRVDEFGAGEGLVEDVDAVIPELRFDTAQASLDPLGGDEGVDERKLKGIGWAVMEQELFGKVFEFGGVFTRNDVGPRIDAGFEGVECGCGFAFW